LAPGDLLLLMTDGLTETMSPGGELFGAARALELARAHRDDTAATMVESLYAAVRDFARGQVPLDDCTLVVVKRIA
jgi:sigma-B regulation protein RsbU (phosphoserine phosphatase)